MNLNDVEQFLKLSYEDFKLSKPEKQSLHQVLDSIKDDPTNLNFVRNRAFDLVAENYRSGESQYLESLKWLEQIVKTIDQVQAQAIKVDNTAYFSPGTECVKKIIALINHAKQAIDVCVFTISDDNITKALKAAHDKKIKLRIVSDNDKANDLGSDIYSMANYGIPIRLDRSANHMHHKFAIFDNQRIVNGSFNWTRSATKYNEENILVSNDCKLVNQFSNCFEKLWRDSQAI